MTEPLLLALDGARRGVAARVGERGRRIRRREASASGWCGPRARLPHAIRSVARRPTQRWPRPPGRAGAAASPCAARYGAWLRSPSTRRSRSSASPFFSRVVVGQWFVSSDFFVPENKAQGLPVAAAGEIVWGTTQLSGATLVGAGRRRRGVLLVVLGLAVRRRASIPHPRRAGRHGCRAVAGVSRRPPVPHPLHGPADRVRGRRRRRARRARPRRSSRPAAASASPTLLLAVALVGGVAVLTLRPLDTTAPMVVEAQWDRPNAPVAAAGHRCACARATTARSVMASMGSLGHYMQETSRDGFRPARFPARGQRRHLAGRARGAAAVRRLAVDRRESRGRRHARQARARAPAFPRRVLARVRRRRRRALRASEPDVEREEVVHPAEIDLRAGKAPGSAAASPFADCQRASNPAAVGPIGTRTPPSTTGPTSPCRCRRSCR